MKAFLGCVLMAGAASVSAETLTGIVKQPVTSAPAADSTVTVYDNKTNEPIGRPTTTAADGKYRIEVAKGKNVTVRAVWDAEYSMPGSTIATVSKDPTQANVQLQPPRGSAELVWFQSGVMTAKLGSGSAVATASSLQSQQLSAPARYQFILGAKSVDASEFKGIDQLLLFDYKYSTAVTEGLHVAENQFQMSKTLPSYLQLTSSVKTSLPKDVYFQLLGFIAPSDVFGKEEWKRALGRAASDDSGNVVTWSTKIDATVSPLAVPGDRTVW
jgi:hypothetical protein